MFPGSFLFDQTANSKMVSVSRLPYVVIKEIMKKMSDQPALLQCRLICVEWNQAIDDTSDVMKKITFPVRHPEPFLDLGIVKRKKVKSIKFMNTFQLQSECANKFIDLISDTIKVDFAFEDSDLLYQRELFELVLAKCGRLQELVISYRTQEDTPYQY